MVKRCFDFFVALFGLIILTPAMLLISVLIRFKLGSPVLFTQERPGLAGKPFHLYKFRSMNEKRDLAGNLLPDEQRLVPFGKLLRRLSLDELPQLINVIKGDLSLVGPRPLLMQYLHRYTAEQARRHEVKPGITGWAQINGRNAISWEEKFQLDVWYVKNRSFLLDMKILFKTFAKVLEREGINQQGQATMEEFMGTESEKRSSKS